MRVVTVSGTMRLYTLFQVVPSTTRLEQLVDERLQQYGWSVLRVSITRNSYLNNTLNVSIQILATGNDISQRIDDSLSVFLSAFEMDGDNPFRDVNLRVTSDTGVELPAATGAAGTPKSIPTKTSKPPVINGGVLATVTVRASDEDSNESSAYNLSYQPNPPAAISPMMIVVGGILLLILMRR